MDMYIPLLEKDRIYADLPGIGLQVGKRRGCTLLHDIAQVSGQFEFTLPFTQARLDEQDISTDIGPGQSHCHPGHIGGLVDLVGVPRLTKDPLHILSGDGALDPALDRIFLGHRPHQGGQLTVEFPYPTLAGVLFDDHPQYIGTDLQRNLSQAMHLLLLGHEVTDGDLLLLLYGIAAEFDDLQAVPEGRLNALYIIGRSDEQDLAQVIFQLQIIVIERMVLLRIQHFQQGGRRIAAMIPTDLVDLIQDHDRIGGLHLSDRLQDATGHRTDVGLAMTADLTFIMQTAQTDAGILATDRIGDASTQRGFTDAGRSDKTEDRTLHITLQLQYREIFQDPFLDPVHPIMIDIQHFLRLAQVVTVF